MHRGGNPRSARLYYAMYRITIWLPRSRTVSYIAIRYENRARACGCGSCRRARPRAYKRISLRERSESALSALLGPQSQRQTALVQF